MAIPHCDPWAGESVQLAALPPRRPVISSGPLSARPGVLVLPVGISVCGDIRADEERGKLGWCDVPTAPLGRTGITTPYYLIRRKPDRRLLTAVLNNPRYRRVQLCESLAVTRNVNGLPVTVSGVCEFGPKRYYLLLVTLSHFVKGPVHLDPSTVGTLKQG
jgi:hypothetical protein